MSAGNIRPISMPTLRSKAIIQNVMSSFFEASDAYDRFHVAMRQMGANAEHLTATHMALEEVRALGDEDALAVVQQEWEEASGLAIESIRDFEEVCVETDALLQAAVSEAEKLSSLSKGLQEEYAHLVTLIHDMDADFINVVRTLKPKVPPTLKAI